MGVTEHILSSTSSPYACCNETKDWQFCKENVLHVNICIFYAIVIAKNNLHLVSASRLISKCLCDQVQVVSHLEASDCPHIYNFEVLGAISVSFSLLCVPFPPGSNHQSYSWWNLEMPRCVKHRQMCNRGKLTEGRCKTELSNCVLFTFIPEEQKTIWKRIKTVYAL